jgi:acyl-CoA ligase (AMP-forming) (exosortase A-associated)
MSSLTTTVYQLLSDNLPHKGDAVAVVDDELDVTYGALSQMVDQIASQLQQSGVVPGDRVVIQLRKSAVEVAAMFAAAKVGAVIVNINSQWTHEQLIYVAQDSGARLILIEPKAAERLAGSQLQDAVVAVLVNGPAPQDARYRNWSAEPGEAASEEAKRLASDLAMIIYTSGSTGMPKGVMLSNANILAGARSVARYLKLDQSDRLLSVLPYSFDYGLNQLTTMMLVGGTVVHQAVPLAAEVVATMVRHNVTGLAAVPPLWGQIVRLLAAMPRRFPALRRITNSGGKIPPNILEQMPEVFPGVDIYLMYGLTEAFRSTYLAPARFSTKLGSIGRAIPDAEVFVIQEGKGIAGPHEEGELVHRGPLVSMGYWGRPELTAEKIRPCPELSHLIGDEPVVYSGDTVKIDEDGDIWFVGRRDGMIKTSGFRVSPDEVEDAIHRSALITEVVAFGVANDELGQVVHVALTPIDPMLREEDILRYCRRSMPNYMIPRRVHIWSQLMPRTSSGKLDRPAVVQACKASSEKAKDAVEPSARNDQYPITEETVS